MELNPEGIREHAATIIEFNQFLADKNYNGDRQDMEICVGNLLYDLLEKWSSHNQTLVDWKDAVSEYTDDVILIYSYNAATSVILQILFNKDGIFLEMGIECPENLPLMPDDFWQQWTELSSFGNFELSENEVFSEKKEIEFPELFPASTSNIFRLMRNLIAFPILYERSIDWGKLSIGWPYDQFSIKEVFEKGNLAFERLCHLNTRLRAGK